MAAYRVFEFPDALPEHVADGRNVELVRDGFSFFALLVPPIWLWRNKVWFGFFIYIAFALAIVLMSELINPLIGVLLNNLLGLYLGFEGTNWKAKEYLSNGWNEVDLVLAGDDEEAEMYAFARRGAAITPVETKPTPGLLFEPPKRRQPVKTRTVIGGFQPISPRHKT